MKLNRHDDLARIRGNILRIRSEIESAAQKVGRDPETVHLLAAVKYLERDSLNVLAEAGLTLLGENRAKELVEKANVFPGIFRWHFIGQLQSRKVKEILPYVELIHSVDSESVMKQLERYADSKTKILIEVNVSGEPAKAGVSPEELPAFIESSSVDVVGLMTMPPQTDDPESSRPYFRALRELASKLGLKELSMGTSQDFAVAVEEGATIVRLGSILWDRHRTS